MTTVVVDLRSGQIGSDLFWSNSNGERMQKIFATKHLGIFGCAGAEKPIGLFLNWIVDNGQRPEPFSEDDGGFEAIQVHEGKIFSWSWSLRPREILRFPFHAVGSGGGIAIAALRGGASLKEALAIAADLDAGTKPPFQIVRIA